MTDNLGPNFHRFVTLCVHVCWDTPSEKSSLEQLPKVSSAYKVYYHYLNLVYCFDELINSLTHSFIAL